MKEAIASFQSSLPWSERLDIVAEVAPMAPELSMEVCIILIVIFFIPEYLLHFKSKFKIID